MDQYHIRLYGRDAVPLSGEMPFCLSGHQLMDIGIASIFLAVRNMNNARVNIHVQVLTYDLCSFPLGM